MALINCIDCGKSVSDKARACLNCGAPIASINAPAQAMAAPASQPEEESSGRMGILKWVLIVVFGMFVYQCATFSDIQGAPTSAASATKGISSLDALLLCQTTIKRLARDPETASIPYVEDMGRGTESHFAWGASTKMARMRNGLGLEVATSASCIVDRDAKRITSLTLDGKTII